MEGYSNASGHTHNNGNLTFIFFFPHLSLKQLY